MPCTDPLKQSKKAENDILSILLKMSLRVPLFVCYRETLLVTLGPRYNESPYKKTPV